MATQFQEIINYSKSQYSSDDVINKNITNINDYISEQGDYKCTLLNCCIIYKNYDLIKKCISFGADVNKCNNCGKPPLYMAFWFYQYDTAELLLQSGADPNILIDGTPIISCNLVIMNEQVIRILIKYGALLNKVYDYYSNILPNKRKIFIKLLAKRRWVKIKCIVKILSIHKRSNPRT